MCRRPHTFQHDEIEKRDVISLLMDCCWPSSEREIGSSFLRSAYGCARAYAYQVDGGSSIRVRREVCGSRREVYITFLDLRLIKHLVVFCLGFLYIAGDDVIIYIYTFSSARRRKGRCTFRYANKRLHCFPPSSFDQGDIFRIPASQKNNSIKLSVYKCIYNIIVWRCSSAS